MSGENHDHVVKNGFTPAVNARERFCHDLDGATARDLDYRLKLQSVASFQAKATSTAHLLVPSVYLVCEDDQGIPMALQQSFMADARKPIGVIDEERLFCGNSPFFQERRVYSNFLGASS